MTITAVKQRFRSGAIDKPGFIAEAFEAHRALFDYSEALRDTAVAEIAIDAEGVRFRVEPEGIVLRCPPGEARVAPLEILNFDRYEPEETRAMDRLAAGARCILDIGANIGWYAVRFAKRLPGVEVHAFEPLPTTYAYLQRNVALNGVGDRVATYCHGLSEQGGCVDFHIAPGNGTNASLRNVAASSQARRITGLVATLDDWADGTGARPDFVKCDVEGAELLVFRGGARTLAAHRPVVFAELLRKWSRPFGYHPNDAIDFFAGLGYACHAVGTGGVRPIDRVTDDTVETNYAFLHREAHAGLAAALLAEQGAAAGAPAT